MTGIKLIYNPFLEKVLFHLCLKFQSKLLTQREKTTATKSAEVEMNFSGRFRRVGFLTQDRASNNGVWLPEHHLKAIEIISYISIY